MDKRTVRNLALAASLALVAGGVLAQPKSMDIGKREYDANCASCHGAKGKGDGPVAPYLSRKASDLTGIAKANGGALPVSRLYEVIDGTTLVATHGERDMPVWGWDYKLKAADYFFDIPYQPEAYVRGRILSLIDYIDRLQVR